MPAPPEKAAEEIAPTGRLRASINLGNIVLAQTDPATGAPAGVTVELAKQLGQRLGVPVDLVTFDAAGKAFDAFKRGVVDIVFLAIDPVRAEEVAFTPPYALIEGNFMVRANSAFKSMADIDKSGTRVAVAKGSAYDLFLTRALKAAELVRSATGPEAMGMFVSANLEAAAGVRQPIVQFMASTPGLRMIEPSFMEIRQAMGMVKGRPTGAAYLHGFIEEMKASGMVAAALKRSGQDDVVVAPPMPA
jgi:polar amino acid transport system substrate-binding protein